MITDPFLNEYQKLTSFDYGAETQYLFCVGRDNRISQGSNPGLSL